MSTLLGWVVARRTGIALERIGSRYGGWIVPSALTGPGRTCYLAGLGEDSSLDCALARRGCDVFVFDPTPRAIDHAATAFAGMENVRFTPVGLWSSARTLRFFAPANADHVSHSVVNLQGTSEWFEAECQTLTALMEEFGHAHIDLLKLDIEGAEFEVLRHMLGTALRPYAVCVEFDQPTAFLRVALQLWRFRRAGYRVVATEGWNVTVVHDSARLS